jgi:hypothetical protein
MFHFSHSRWALVLLLLMALILAGFFWNEARKEIVFLCGNFVPGVSQESVTRQLDTGHFLQYRLLEGDPTARIVASSKINFERYKCIVDFDSDGAFIHAELK